MSEINRLLKNKDSSIQKLEDQKQLLLSAGDNTDKFENLKKDLKWDDTDNEIKDEYRKVLELSHAASQIKDSKILDIDTIHEYCIDNNYILIKITDYKGKITNELLEAIENYCKANDMRTASDANINKLYLLCSLVDTQSNENIKKSKRYKNTNLSKIILFERLDKGNQYSNNLFKIVFEMGEKKHIRDFINSLFKTHYKTFNILGNIIPHLVVASVWCIIFLVITFFSNNICIDCLQGNNITYYWLMFITSTILIIKIFISDVTKDGLNRYGYDNFTDYTYEKTYRVLASILYFNKANTKIIKKIKIKAYLGSIIIIIGLNIYALTLNKINNKIIEIKNSKTIKK